MGMSYNTKIITLAMLVLLVLTSGFKISSRTNQDSETQGTPETPTVAAESTTVMAAENEAEGVNFFASSESLAFYRSSDNRLGEKLKKSQPVFRVTTRRENDSTRDQERDSIDYSNERIRNLVRDQYMKVRDTFDFKSCQVYIFDDSFFFRLVVTDGQVTVEREKLIKDFLNLPKQYEEINSLFNIEDDIVVADAELGYYFNEKKDGFDERDFLIALNIPAGFYRVEALTVDLKTMLIKVPRNQQFGTWVSYQGTTDLDNGSGIKTLDTKNINNGIPVHTDLWSYTIKNFDRRKAEFEWNIRLRPNQMNVNILITLLDQANAVDKRISPQLGETDNVPFDTTQTLLAPKGLDSFNLLSVINANFTSSAGSLKYIIIQPRVPDFAFLPIELETVSNACSIVYVSGMNYYVRMTGKTVLDGSAYRSEFIKESAANFYNITLSGDADSQISFRGIKNSIFSTMEVGYKSTVLTTDESILARLAPYGITEDDTIIEQPVISISYDTFLMYNVRGRFSYGPTEAQRISVDADFVNLDGFVLAYVRFGFRPQFTRDSFRTFFMVTAEDAGVGSLEMLNFQLISTNRDFNTDMITQLRHGNIIVYQSDDVIIKDGLTAVLSADIKEDCDEYVFCRLMKNLEVPSAVTFSGIVRETNTRLVSNFANFTLNEDVKYRFNSLILRIGQDAQQAKVFLTLKGRMYTYVEPDREMAFKTLWGFGDAPETSIAISGDKNTIYSNVFKTNIIDMVEGEITGRINPDRTISGFNYTATAIIGNNCYEHMEYTDQLKTDQSSSIYKVKDFDSKDIDMNGELSIIGDGCKVGKSELYIFSDKPEKNTFLANFFFDDFEDLLKIIFDVKSDDKVIPLIRLIEFPDGLTTLNTYSKVKEGKPLDFIGRMDFLGVHTFGHVFVYPDDERADSVLYLPSFSIGGGNLQFLMTEDLKRNYNINEDTFKNGRLDVHINKEQFLQNNTLNFSFDTQNIAGADIILSSNIVIFEILDRAQITLDKDRWIFRVEGRPFRGAFQAEVVVELVPVPDIQKESDAMARVVLEKSENFFELEDLVNAQLENWVSNIIIAKLQLEDKKADLLKKRAYLTSKALIGQDCQDTEQCQDLPTIKCSEYAKKAICIREEQVCKTVAQQCIRTETQETNWGTYDVCVQYETVCKDETYTNVCVDYDIRNIPDECITMELTCTKVFAQDLSCAEDFEQLKSDIQEVDDDLAKIVELEGLLVDLTDSSVCLLRVTDKDAKKKYASCDEKDVTIEGRPESFDILNFFSLRDSRSVMELRNVISSDSMIFESDISLYGDWTTKKGPKDRMIVKNSVHVEREDSSKGYDVGAESLMYINHVVDFNSINHTSYELSESVKQIVCKENHIEAQESLRIQLLMRELSIVDGNSTICPTLEVLNNNYIERADNLGVTQASIYASYKGDDKYVSDSVKTSDVAGLTFSYKPSAETLPVSEIREDYAGESVILDYVPLPLATRLDYQTVEEMLETERNRNLRLKKEREDEQLIKDYIISIKKKASEDKEQQVEIDKQQEEQRKLEEQQARERAEEAQRRAEEARQQAIERQRQAEEQAKKDAEERERRAIEERERLEREAEERVRALEQASQDIDRQIQEASRRAIDESADAIDAAEDAAQAQASYEAAKREYEQQQRDAIDALNEVNSLRGLPLIAVSQETSAEASTQTSTESINTQTTIRMP